MRSRLSAMIRPKLSRRRRRIGVAEVRERLAAIGGGDDVVAFVLQVEAQQADDVGFVVGDEDPGAHGSTTLSPPAPSPCGGGIGIGPGDSKRVSCATGRITAPTTVTDSSEAGRDPFGSIVAPNRYAAASQV